MHECYLPWSTRLKSDRDIPQPSKHCFRQRTVSCHVTEKGMQAEDTPLSKPIHRWEVKISLQWISISGGQRMGCSCFRWRGGVHSHPLGYIPPEVCIADKLCNFGSLKQGEKELTER